MVPGDGPVMKIPLNSSLFSGYHHAMEESMLRIEHIEEVPN
jgi:hypothetical protein